MGTSRRHRTPRRRLLPLLIAGVLLAAGIAALAVIPTPTEATTPPSYRTTYFASTREVCDLTLTPHVFPPNATASAIATWQLSRMDFEVPPLGAIDPDEVSRIADLEIAELGKAARSQLEITLRRLGSAFDRVEVVTQGRCLAPARANEAGEQPIDPDALLAGREPTGLLADADFEGFFVTSTGVVCELALRVMVPADSDDVTVVAMREYFQNVDLTTFPPRADDWPWPQGSGISVEDFESSVMMSRVAGAAFDYAVSRGGSTSDFGTEGSTACD